MDLLHAAIVLMNFIIVPGIAYGSQLALGALGVTLVFGVLRFANFAHGDTMAFGTMGTILVTWWLQASGITIQPLPTALLALPVGIAMTIVLVLLTDSCVFRYYRSKRAPPITLAIASLGVMLVYNGIVRFIIGPGNQNFADGERFLISAREFKTMTGLQEGLAIKTSQVITLAVAVTVVILLFWFLNRTRLGKAMRAFADNEDLASLSGIRPDRIVTICWITAAALATIAGTLYGLDKSFKPFTYFQLLLPIFAAAVVGGLGSPVGAIAGAFLVAFSEITVTYAFKKVLGYALPDALAPSGLMQLLSTDYKLAVSFSILVIVLLYRPTGLFGVASR